MLQILNSQKLLKSFEAFSLKINLQLFSYSSSNLKNLKLSLILIGVFQFHNLDREIFPRMIVGAQKVEVIVDRGRSRFTSVLLRAVAAPNDAFRLAVGNHVLVAVVQQHLATFRRLSEYEFLLAEFLAAHDFLEDLRDVSDCREEKENLLVLCLNFEFQFVMKSTAKSFSNVSKFIFYVQIHIKSSSFKHSGLISCGKIFSSG